MENVFGLDEKIIKQALTNGIKVNRNGQFVDIKGFISLTYIAQYDKFVLAYGTSAFDAGWVFVDSYQRDWILR